MSQLRRMMFDKIGFEKLLSKTKDRFARVILKKLVPQMDKFDNDNSWQQLFI